MVTSVRCVSLFFFIFFLNVTKFTKGAINLQDPSILKQITAVPEEENQAYG